MVSRAHFYSRVFLSRHARRAKSIIDYLLSIFYPDFDGRNDDTLIAGRGKVFTFTLTASKKNTCNFL